MATIRSHGNKATELRMIAIFQKFGITGWRRKQKVIGSPDFTFRRERLAVFVDGCFCTLFRDTRPSRKIMQTSGSRNSP